MKDQPTATPREGQVFGLSAGNKNRQRKVPRISVADKQDMVLPILSDNELQQEKKNITHTASE